MHDRKHLCHLGKARGRSRIELSMIVTYFQCLTFRVRSGHLSNALTRERSWLTEKLASPPYQSQSVVDSFTYYKKPSSDPPLGQQYNRLATLGQNETKACACIFGVSRSLSARIDFAQLGEKQTHIHCNGTSSALIFFCDK